MSFMNNPIQYQLWPNSLLPSPRDSPGPIIPPRTTGTLLLVMPMERGGAKLQLYTVQYRIAFMVVKGRTRDVTKSNNMWHI